MGKIWLYGFVLICSLSCNSQDSTLLISKENIGQLSNYHFYNERTITNNKEKSILTPEFAFLDSIQISNITYISDGYEVKGVIIEPLKKGVYPAIIFNRGGNRDFAPVNLSYAALDLGPLAQSGYVIIASQYRGNLGGEGKEEFGGAEVNDILNLIPILEKMENVDRSKIGMYGWSRGGMMTYIALSKTDKIKAAVVGGAVTDMRKLIKDRPSMETNVLAELVPNYEKNKEEELNKRSAVLWANLLSKTTPILVLHGNADWRVKPEQSLNMALEFEKFRIPYRLVMFEGGDHGITEHYAEKEQQILNWFDMYLKNDKEVSNMQYHGR